MASDHGADVSKLMTDKKLLHSLDLEPYITKTTGLPTLTDIVLELEKPGRDPRETTVTEEPYYEPGVKSINDLHLDMVVTGKINNITAFGVFVDLGIKENGLIHISQLSDRFIKSANEVVSVGQTVRVKIIDIDTARGRVALTMKDIPQI